MNDFAPQRPSATPGLLGSAFIALWNDVEAGREGEYDAWHTGEHVPQRVGIPGVHSGRRYVAADMGAPGEARRYLTLYDLRGPDVLDSAAYRGVVQHPTPWSAAMRPSLQRFLRLPCRRVLSLGGGIGGAIATVRLPAAADLLRPHLVALLRQPGVTVAHLGEPCRDGQPFPLDDGTDAGGGGLLLLEGTAPEALREALSGYAHLLHGSPAFYSLALIVAKPPGGEEC